MIALVHPSQFVMPGLDPGIQGPLAQPFAALDCRVKPGNDEFHLSRFAAQGSC